MRMPYCGTNNMPLCFDVFFSALALRRISVFSQFVIVKQALTERLSVRNFFKSSKFEYTQRIFHQTVGIYIEYYVSEDICVFAVESSFYRGSIRYRQRRE